MIIKPASKPKLFIGSSRESMRYGPAIHSNLQRVAQVLPWYNGTFQENDYTMESLSRRLSQCDYGVFIFSPDDVAVIRHKPVFITRDNTIFEAGLFMGRLGLKRVFCLIPQDLEVSDGEHIKDVRVGTYHLLSDLAGITLLQYEYGHDDELEAAVSVACARMAKVIAEESFFIDPIDKAKRNGSIVKLFWEMSRIVPLTEEAPLSKRYHALSEGIRVSFLVPPLGETKVTHVALYAKQGTDGMAYAAGNIDEGAFYSFQSVDSEKEPPIVIKVQQSNKWSFTHEQHVEKVSVLCYPLGENHVLSINLVGDSVLTKEHLQKVVDHNAELLTTIKHIVGGDSK